MSMQLDQLNRFIDGLEAESTPTNPSPLVSFRLPIPTFERLKQQAAAEHRSISAQIRHYVIVGLDALEK